MKPRFKMTYEVVTGESARQGDFAQHGFLPRSGDAPLYRNNMPKNPARFTLRQVLDLMVPRGSGPCEADSCPCRVPRWVSCQVTDNDADRCVSLSVHLDDVSDASARRVARLLNCYGIKP